LLLTKGRNAMQKLSIACVVALTLTGAASVIAQEIVLVSPSVADATAASSQSQPGRKLLPPAYMAWIVEGPTAADMSARSPQVVPLARAIVDWLAINSQLPAIRDVPRIEFASPYTIAAIRYNNAPPVGDIDQIGTDSQVTAQRLLARYDERSRTIFLPEGWSGSTLAETAVLVREMVRHIQHIDAIEYACPESRDMAAYSAQKKWADFHDAELPSELALPAGLVKALEECTPLP
jgi:hypothetical protein